MDLPRLEPIEYRGELVALVSPTQFHVISPSLRDRPAGDYDREFVILMCLCCREALNGRLPGDYSNEIAASWAGRVMQLKAGNV